MRIEIDRETCTGCGACIMVCPQKAISFKDDQEGFPTPFIDNAKCVDCGLCEKVCPASHMPETNRIQAAYAAQIVDKDALADSTSGGLFTVFAREIFRRGGVVYGCVWDREYNAVVCKAENEAEIKPMRGSKYVWSNAAHTYPEIKKYLEGGRTVLFTGLPCQVAGLKNYLRKDYDKLYLIDFFCGGSPSPYAFHEYLKTITDKIPLDQIDFKFRDKAKYGVGVHISYNSPKGSVYQSYVRNPYFFAYHTKVFHRKPCYHCQYRYEVRVEDITMGDYWGVGKFHQEFDIRAGVSAMLINSKKGEELLDAVKNQLKLVPTRVQDIAVGNNLTLGDYISTFQPPIFRDAFFDTLKTEGWTSAEKKYLYNKTRMKLWIETSIFGKVVRRVKRYLSR